MNLHRATLAMLTATFFALPSWAGDIDAVSLGERLANRNCAWCHGPAGKGFSTAPRLAGQRSQYIQMQLESFKAHTRDNPKSQAYMWRAAAITPPDMARFLAAYYSSLNAEPASDGNADLVARGRALYVDGAQQANIPACVACHGPNAEGAGAVPRLGGLSDRYLKRRLDQWGEGFHAAAAVPMPGVASKLSADDIEVLASYLSFVK
jgi:cytochrome c553